MQDGHRQSGRTRKQAWSHHQTTSRPSGVPNPACSPHRPRFGTPQCCLEHPERPLFLTSRQHKGVKSAFVTNRIGSEAFELLRWKQTGSVQRLQLAGSHDRAVQASRPTTHTDSPRPPGQGRPPNQLGITILHIFRNGKRTPTAVRRWL